MVGHLIQLRRAIQRNTPPWKRRLGLVLGLVAAATTWAAVAFPAPHARADALTLCLSAWLLGWMIGPILGNGASILRPEYFTLMSSQPARAGFALLTSVFAGTGALVTTIAASALILFSAVSGGPAGIIVGVVATMLFLIFVIALSRILYTLLGSAMRTPVGVQIAAVSYGAVVAVITVGWLLIVPLIGLVPEFLTQGFASDAVESGFQASPAGWPVLAIQTAAGGDLPGALALIGALTAVTGAVVALAALLLAPRPRPAVKSRRRTRLGSTRPWGILPATPLGAVVGRELRTWTRDPCRQLELWLSIWFGVFVALIAAIAGLPHLAVLAGVGVAVMVTLRGTNLYGFDGTALWQIVVAERVEAIRADVRGRQLALALFFGAPALALSAVTTALTGAGPYALAAISAIIALTGAGAGVAIAASVLWPTPGADPHRRVNASDVGDNPLVYRLATWVTFLLTSPTIVAAVFVALDPGWLPTWTGWTLLPLAIANGAVPWALLGSFTARHLASRLPETLARMQHTATAASLSSMWASVMTVLDKSDHTRPLDRRARR